MARTKPLSRRTQSNARQYVKTIIGFEFAVRTNPFPLSAEAGDDLRGRRTPQLHPALRPRARRNDQVERIPRNKANLHERFTKDAGPDRDFSRPFVAGVYGSDHNALPRAARPERRSMRWGSQTNAKLFT